MCEYIGPGISKATATATATASDNATATAAKTSSATSSAAAIPNVQVAAPAVGFMGLLVALAAI